MIRPCCGAKKAISDEIEAAMLLMVPPGTMVLFTTGLIDP